MQEKGRKPASKLKERAMSAFVCLGFLAFLGFLVYPLLEVRQNRQALGWPTTTGRVMSSEVSESYNAEADDTSYYFDATYAYQVGARRLSGHSSLGPFSWVADAREWVEAYPPGSWVSVHYNPRDPQKSAVWPEAHINRAYSELSLLLVLVLLALLVCGVAFVRRLWKRVQRQSSALGTRSPEYAAILDRSSKEQEVSAPTIGDVEVIHPRRALLQTVSPRKDAEGWVVANLVFLLVFGGAVAAGFARNLTPEDWGDYLPGLCPGALLVPVSLPALIYHARIAIWGRVLTFSGETGTIERNGKLLARFDEVSCVEVRNKSWTFNVGIRQLSIILKPHERVRICEVSEAERAAQVELAKELGQMLGVGVTFSQYVG